MSTPKSAPLRSIMKPERPRLSVTFASSPLNTLRRNEEERLTVFDGEDDPNYVDSDSGSSLFYWDDEATLLDELMDKPLKKDGDATVLALADSLRDAFTERGKLTKFEMARVLVSAHSQVKRALRLLSDQDESYGKCVVQFAKGCKRSEAAYMHIGKILEKYIANQVQIERLRVQIKADLAEREAIWARLEKSMKEILKPLRERIQDAPARIERKITQLEELAKASEKKRQTSIPKDLQSYFKNL